MTDGAAPGYGFADGVPIDPLDPGTTVLVAGPALSPAEDLARSLVADGTDAGDGMLFISTNTTCDKLLDACRETHPSIDTSRLGVIDCSGQEIDPARSDVRLKYVSTQSDLTGIGMKFSALYQSLYETAEGGRVRTGLTSLTSLSMYVDLRALFRFAQSISGRISSAGGLGVFTIDPTTQDTKAINTLAQVADGRIEVRESEPEAETDAGGAADADGELRVRGLPDRSDDWQPFTLSY